MKLGFVGYRGMTGSVLLRRMMDEGDFNGWDTVFFSSLHQGKSPPFKLGKSLVQSPWDINRLFDCDTIISCQGGEYTRKIHSKLRERKWQGFWLDTSSFLRTWSDAIIPLDPVNEELILDGIKRGIKSFAGANCTVSLMLLALHGLFKKDLVEWISNMTYQAVSGAGAIQMNQLYSDSKLLHEHMDMDRSPLENERCMRSLSKDLSLVYNLRPWIDREEKNGQTKEEWKGSFEAGKILGLQTPIPIDGTCVRIPTLRSHCQGMTVKLKQDIPLDEVEEIISQANDWVKIIPNEKDKTQRFLSPMAVSETLFIHVGRLRKMTLGKKYLNAFVVGDQLLWGAAEPVRRVLGLIRNHSP